MNIKFGLCAIGLFLLLSACKRDVEKVDTTAFDAAYPAMYQELSLPEYRRGTLKSVDGKTEGVKTVHTITIESEDSPSYLRDFFHPNITKLGWRDLNSRKRLSDIDKSDLYFATYVKGRNKVDINSSALPKGGSKTRIVLSIFGAN